MSKEDEVTSCTIGAMGWMQQLRDLGGTDTELAQPRIVRTLVVHVDHRSLQLLPMTPLCDTLDQAGHNNFSQECCIVDSRC
jgi:hypothetical protein